MVATVIYDGDCALCTRIRELTSALDWFGAMHWIPQQDPAAARFGIPAEALRNSVFLIAAGGASHGWGAVKRIAVRIPLSYLVAAWILRRKPWAAVGIGLLFSPLFNPMGDRLYEWVARNRYRFPGSTCALPVWDNRTE